MAACRRVRAVWSSAAFAQRRGWRPVAALRSLAADQTPEQAVLAAAALMAVGVTVGLDGPAPPWPHALGGAEP